MTLGEADKYVIVGGKPLSLDELQATLAKQGVIVTFGRV